MLKKFQRIYKSIQDERMKYISRDRPNFFRIPLKIIYKISYVSFFHYTILSIRNFVKKQQKYISVCTLFLR
jgi:hypothetical protein